MKTREKKRPLLDGLNRDAPRNYVLGGAVALAVVYIALLGRGSGIGGLIVLFVAAPGLVLRWVVSPVLALMLVSYFLFDPSGLYIFDSVLARAANTFRAGFSPRDNFMRPLDLLAVAGVMAYLICAYRALSLTHRGFPSEGQTSPDRSRRRPEVRPDSAVPEGEAVSVAVIALAAVAAGQVAWYLLHSVRLPVALPERLQRLLFALWALVSGALIATAALGYVRRRDAAPEEALQFLQDVAWEETDREQRRVHVWRDWFRKRYGGGGDG